MIGSTLTTGLCVKLASKAEQLVEINPSPVIEVGRVYQFREETGKVLKEVLREIGEKK